MVTSQPHIVIFPFMAKGHTIPLLHLARLFLQRRVSVTILTTPANSPFIRGSLTDTDASVVELPFPRNILQLPAGVESTDKLPSLSMSFFLPFANATKLMQPDFEDVLQNLPKVTCMITDGFMGWTQHSATKLGLPRFVFYGMGSFAWTVSGVVSRDKPHANVNSDDEVFSLPAFPWIKLTKNDLEDPFNDPEPKGPHFEFIREQVISNIHSKGYIVNSFYELEPQFVDYSNTVLASKQWCVGPLCLAQPPKVQTKQKPMWIQWLDEKLGNGQSVMYIAFGSQAKISEEQLEEIAVGLEKSNVNFLWVVRMTGFERLNELKERVKERGLIVREWVDQVEILNHESVNGFMSHCGWNSVIESICASVPIVAWPMMAEQHLNARLVVEELSVGVRVLARNGSVRGFVGRECIEMMAKELMEGEEGKEVRKKMKEMGELGRKAMEEGGSSWHTLNLLIEDMCAM